jgi:hypothetical protein
MRPCSRPITGIAVLAFLFASAVSMRASTCTSAGPVCSEYWKTDLVFVGTVSDVYQPEIADGESWAPAAIARFVVEEAFRGVNSKEIEIAGSIRRAGPIAFSSDGMGYQFERGKRYLVYARRSSTDRWLWASICSRTMLLDDAGDDLKYIRGLATAKPGATIQGTVRRRGDWITDELAGPLRGIRVIAQLGSIRAETVTDSMGEYRLNRLKLGTYKVSVLVPRNFMLLGNRDKGYFNVSLTQDRGCVETHFDVAADGRLAGVVTDSDGRPVPGVNIDIVAARQTDDEQFRNSWTTRTDANGRYEHRPIPQGQYYLGINIAGGHSGVGYEPSYYPGIGDIGRAQIISIGEGEQLRDLNFRVPPVTARRTIEGMALTSDMKPISGALIALESAEDGKPRWDLAVKTDEQGRFAIKEHDSYIVWVHARAAGPDGKPRHAEPVWLEKRIGEITPFQMIVSAPGAFCTHYR